MLGLFKLILTQIVFESLPVSSSGHVDLAVCFVADKNTMLASWLSRALHMPEIMMWLQVPTVCVVALFFAREWLFLFFHFQNTWRIVAKLIFYMLCSNSITTLCFILVHTYECAIPLWAGFGCTMLALLSLIWCKQRRNCSLTFSHALFLGLIQGVALLPGISRFAAVFVAARWMGIKNQRAFFITWMLQWPIVLGMSFFAFAQYSVHPTHLLPINFLMISSVLIAATIALLGMYGMYQLVLRDKLWIMSIYMILPLALSILYCR